MKIYAKDEGGWAAGYVLEATPATFTVDLSPPPT